jgi:hypothetical protein
MLIEGPLNISVGEPADGQGKVLVLAFPPAFRALGVTGQAAELRGYLLTLGSQMAGLGEQDPSRQGMAIVAQIVEQLLPHVEAEELELAEPIIIQIRQEADASALSDLLRQAQL